MMVCRNPYLAAPRGVDQKGFVNSDKARLAATPFPCGNCLPCRILKSRVWKIRILLEMMQYDDNNFTTLTYEDENLTRDDDGTPQVDPRDLTLFLKRIRKKIKFRYFAVGEYGDTFARPHFHLAMFGVPESASKLIADSWQNGAIHVTELNEGTADYIVGYAIKKLTKEGDEYLYGKKPEIMRCSKGTKKNNNGGLGKRTIEEVGLQFKKQDYFKPRIIRELRAGKSIYPLGGYLTRKLADYLGVSHELWQKELIDYQSKILLQFAKGSYRQNIIDNGKGKADSMEAKHKIFRSKRRL